MPNTKIYSIVIFHDCFQRNEYNMINEHQTLKAAPKILG